jgi:7-cyano-7-deazaguanine synthase in queuosine biosynthesis
MALNKILLFSGGLDSFILKRIFNFSDHECLFVHIGTAENTIEELHINKYFPGVHIEYTSLVVHEMPNKIIPFRNNHLALIAANYANNIYFGFTAGDTTKDKDFVFKAQMECILNYFSQDVDKVHVYPPFEIKMPFKRYTKTQLVGMYLERHLPVEDLFLKSTSCYNAQDKPCGLCRSCLRKYVALTLNGISTDGSWVANPSDYIEGFYQESIIKNRTTELKDIEKCIYLLQQ